MKDCSCFHIAYYVECKKIKRNGETLLLFTMSLLPVFYSVAFALHSGIVQYVSSEKADFLTYFMALSLSGAIALIFHVIYAFYTAGFLAGEIASGSALLYVTRYHDRKGMFRAKALSLQRQLIVSTFVFFLICIPCYILICETRPDSFNGQIFPSKYAITILAMLFSIWSSFAITIAYVLCMAACFKFVPTVGIFFVMCLGWNVFENFPFLQLLSPYFYLMDFARHIPGTGVTGTPVFSVPVLFLLNIVMVFVYIIPSYILGSRKFCSRDLA